MSERNLTNRIFVGGLGLAASVLAATGVEWVQQHDSPGELLASCNIASPPLANEDYKPETAEALLGVEPANLPQIHFYAAACLTLMSKHSLEGGVDVGAQKFGDQGRYGYQNCFVYSADKQLIPAEGLRRTQLIIACDGLEVAPLVLEA